ncbi:MAG: type II toxin-antitoxin system Phd/YefM family antitoxin [Clostridia bacterium]|nr:type II toxin-antitoxin system Phd/YefM family antitoxin [Clostridia bacterium]
MQIIPIRDLKDTNAISKKCHDTAEPVFVTKNGYGDMVIMSMETYQRTMARVELYRLLSEGEADIAAGRVTDGETAMQEILEGIGNVSVRRS